MTYQALKARLSKGPLDEIETRQYLNEIATAISSGKDPEKYQKILDLILDTEISASNPELDAVWENSRRGR